MRNLLRKIRGAIGNAVTWAMAWFGISFLSFGALSLLGLVPGMGLGILLRLALNVGFTGFLAGTGFAFFLGTVYRNHRLEDLRVGRIAAGGAVVAGLISPLLSIAAIGLGASGIGAGFLVANAIGAAIFGGLTAGGTVMMAKRSSARLERGDSGDETQLPVGSSDPLGLGAGGAT